jgi:hypothetical protein
MNVALMAVKILESRSSCNVLGMIVFSFVVRLESHYATGVKQLFMQVPSRLFLVSLTLLCPQCDRDHQKISWPFHKATCFPAVF